jgi:hypothetical protein
MWTCEWKVSESIGKGVNKTVKERLQKKWLNSQKWECVKTAENCTDSAYIYNKFTKKIKNIELFSPTLSRNFPLQKSDFVGIFKYILIGFYCIYYIIIVILMSVDKHFT